MTGQVAMALRLAARDLRGGVRRLGIFVLCLMLGVAAIAAVGTVRTAIQAALVEQGATLLGGDAEVSFTYRMARGAEMDFLADRSERLSETAEFRSMAVTTDQSGRALTQVRAVDGAYPLIGDLRLDPPLAPRDALADGGAVMDGLLADQLGLRPGDAFDLGGVRFTLRARILHEPDGSASGMAFAPRTIVALGDARAGGLLSAGNLFDSSYRLALKPDVDLPALRQDLEAAFPDSGLRWQDRRKPAPGTEMFVDRMADFLVLVGLAALAVGGIGIASAVQDWLAERRETIAALRTLGMESATIHAIYGIEIGLVAALGIGLGLALGTIGLMLAAPMIKASLPIPITPRPGFPGLGLAALYGVLTAVLFTLLPLSRLERIRPAALFRDLGDDAGQRPRGLTLAAVALVLGALVAVSAASTGTPALALGALGGVAAALAALALAAGGLQRLARGMAPRLHGRPALRLALAAIGSPRGGTVAVVLALGLGLSVLAALGQIDANLRQAIAADLPQRAPSYFFVDIQPDQIGPFVDRASRTPGITRTESAPMLRGILTRINGIEARKLAGDHWVLRGDRGISYAAEPPPNTIITAGEWWPADESGPPQVSFSEKEARELGLKLRDRLTINILGRDIEAKITSLRRVDFSGAGIGFVMVMNPAALAGAPHGNIATVHTGPGFDDAGFLRQIGALWPNITAIRISDVIARVTQALDAIARAVALSAGVTLVAGAIVLIGTAASGLAGRRRDAAILRSLGATRGQVRASFALRSALTGAAAGLVASLFGSVAGWAVMRFVMDAPYRFQPLPALAAVLGGMVVVLVAGLAFGEPTLRARPAQSLRARG